VLGIRAIVRKRREVWTVNATTVHLDDVEGLGRFIELETPIDVASGQAHWECAALLEIDPHTDLALSYADLLDGL
jgi:adenylate cyclase class IV